MAGPRHLQDPQAHEEKFRALREEVEEGLEAALSSMFIPGMSIPFSGTFGGSDGKRPINPHTGKANEEFALCDGGTYKSPTGPMLTTPNLQGRFVIGASDAYKAGSVGGDSGHTHPITVHWHTLTAAQMPSHAHNFYIGYDDGTAFGIRNVKTSIRDYNKGVFPIHATGGSQAHAHGASSGASSSLPPYYSLAYIMKL